MKQPFPIHHPIETNIYKWMAIFASRYTYIHIKLFKVVEPIHLKKKHTQVKLGSFPQKIGVKTNIFESTTSFWILLRRDQLVAKESLGIRRYP